MSNGPVPHWSALRWSRLAKVLGRKGEIDHLYLSPECGLTLLVRMCPSFTPRRRTQTLTILSEGDFTWIVVATRKPYEGEMPEGIEVLDLGTLHRYAPSLIVH